MEAIPVVIVGAGPAGLTLALSLAKYEVNCIIFEKEQEITEDPRGVYLAGDAVRILWDIGIRDQMDVIGHDVSTVNFHKSTFQNPPFFQLDTAQDHLNQALSNGILQVQPKLEHALRQQVAKSPFCELRCGCEVVSREECDQNIVVGYKDNDDTIKSIKCSWMIGADGKKGVVRKRFLEAAANIKQETGLFAYEATWVAANLKINLPSPETHPNFPLWDLDFTPQRVYDFFWPAGWHFCNPPGKPTACGRFGPFEDRFWRHEFAEPHWNDSMNSNELLWEHLTPMITRSADELGKPFPTAVTYPRDCIDIRRCRPFTFQQKVVNKWFHNRIVLIGDAAHVFPPFGGQGIACGIRDAHGLAWRLALLLRTPNLRNRSADKLLAAWASERRQGVDDSTRLTMSNGKLANEPETLKFCILRNVLAAFSAIPFFTMPPSPTVVVERAGYKATKNGFFLPEYNGGGKIAQIYCRSRAGRRLLSDELLKAKKAVMSLLVISDDPATEEESVKTTLQAAGIHPPVLSEESFFFFHPDVKRPSHDSKSQAETPELYHPCSPAELDETLLRPGYDKDSYMNRLGRTAKYAILRPDYIIFSVAKDLSELEKCLQLLKGRLEQDMKEDDTVVKAKY